MNIESFVYIVDDDYAVRDSLSLVFEAAGIASETFESAEQFLERYCPGKPGCLLLDVNMPGMVGTELQAELKRRNIQIPIIFLTAYGDIPMTVQTIKAGAVDFLTKPVPPRLLLEHIQAVLQHEVHMYAQTASEHALCNRIKLLTAREQEVMGLVVAGHANKEIAKLLGISHRTVEIHRARVMEKTGASNILELAHICAECRLSA